MDDFQLSYSYPFEIGTHGECTMTIGKRIVLKLLKALKLLPMVLCVHSITTLPWMTGGIIYFQTDQPALRIQ